MNCKRSGRFKPNELVARSSPTLKSMVACLAWKAAERSGDEQTKVDRLEVKYEAIVRNYQNDVYRPPLDTILSAWGNRLYAGRSGGRRYTDSRGIAYDVSDLGF